ncbi:conserved membrane protein, unknown function [Hepatocystis sp. ex Piliocolobus tephrosceles]|nr:conserved membrane protein, unknown function [Hepatocystis sp. ex Piliocolobus tephrosceles]VWU52297.1 conserved membrane protein, unknown function [Hepatocystis sp. ex Piliocolobus tephrosceles]
MVRLGYKRDGFCCLSVAGANIYIAVWSLISLIPFLILHKKDKGTPILDVFYGVSLICGVIFRKAILFMAAIVFESFMLVNVLIVLIYETIKAVNDKTAFFNYGENISSTSLITGVTFSCILVIVVTLYFINMNISMLNILKAGGTGWEHKNFEEIEQEKQAKEIPTIINVHGEYTA